MQPVTGVDVPQRWSLQAGEPRGGALRAPQAARSVVMLAAGDRRADAVLTAVVVHRNRGVVHEHAEPGEVLQQTGAHLVAALACALGPISARCARVVIRCQDPGCLLVHVPQPAAFSLLGFVSRSELFSIIDWMIQLPAGAEAAFRREVYAFAESKQMPYLTTIERAGIEKGL
ncbi:MAG: hypothetical protein N838_21245 [Thiohalocapsa sp. PB-PSB1]|nr:MAG: hypothetical protein N838_21245 [Thiohalocapsa sp. PB-PSB1]